MSLEIGNSTRLQFHSMHNNEAKTMTYDLFQRTMQTNRVS